MAVESALTAAGADEEAPKHAGVAPNCDEARLLQLGYIQELKRDLSGLSNFAFSFSYVSVLTGVTTLYGVGLAYGGPTVMTFGWLVVGVFTLFIGTSMAEICSAYPTSGGLYFWSARLAGDEWAPFASWITGWFNIAAQWAGLASVDYSLAQLLQVIILLSTGGNNGGGYVASKYVLLGFHAAILFSQSVINILPVNWLSILGRIGAAWNVIGVFVLMILVPMVAPIRSSTEFAFTGYSDATAVGIGSKAYTLLIGLLMSQYTLTGYDASAHMSEETKGADKNGPWGIISSIVISVAVGWAYIIGINYAIGNTDIRYLLNPTNDAGGYAIAEVFYLAFKGRYGNGAGAIVCLVIAAGAVFFCGLSIIATTSRTVFAFSRDGAIPLSGVWHRLTGWEVPVNAVWLSAAIAFCIALPALGSMVAFQAMVSMSTICVYIAYGLPVLFRVTLARRTFVPGPFHLGGPRGGLIVGWVAVLWVAFITVAFSLPVSYPVARDAFNYTPAAIGGVAALVVGGWLAGARRWFKGPIANAGSK